MLDRLSDIFRRRNRQLDLPTPEEIEAIDRIRSKKAHELMRSFAEKTRLNLYRYTYDNKAVYVLGKTGLDQETVKKYISSQGIIDQHLTRGRAFSCMQVAIASVRAGVTQGCLSVWNKPTEFQKDFNHTVAYEQNGQGVFQAVDFTAEDGIDRGRGNMEVLVIKAETKEELIDYLHKLYGGKWFELSREDMDEVKL